MPKKREGRFIKALRERQEEARKDRARREREEAAEGESGERRGTGGSEKPEDKALVDRPPALWPSKRHRPPWK